MRPEPRLRERDAGEWTGLTRAEIDERWPGYLLDGRRPPGFELDDAILGRVLAALARPSTALTPASIVLAVAHGGVIRAVERHLGIDDGLVPNLGGRVLDVHEALADARRPARARRPPSSSPRPNSCERSGGRRAARAVAPFTVEVVRSRKRRKTVGRPAWSATSCG